MSGLRAVLIRDAVVRAAAAVAGGGSGRKRAQQLSQQPHRDDGRHAVAGGSPRGCVTLAVTVARTLPIRNVTTRRSVEPCLHEASSALSIGSGRQHVQQLTLSMTETLLQSERCVFLQSPRRTSPPCCCRESVLKPSPATGGKALLGSQRRLGATAQPRWTHLLSQPAHRCGEP